MTQPQDYWHISGGGGYVTTNVRDLAESGGVVNQVQPLANIMWAMPVFVGDAGVFVQKMGLSAAIAGAANARLGIYACPPPSAHDMYPGALVYDFGAVSLAGAAGGKYTANAPAGSVQLTAGYYWAAGICSAAASQLRYQTQWNGPSNPMGASVANVGYLGWSVAQAFGALPATFPAGAAATPQDGSLATIQRSLIFLIERE